MIGGGIGALPLGAQAEGQSLEDIAKPLTADDAETSSSSGADGPGRRRGAVATG